METQVALVAELQDFFRKRAEVELDYSKNLDKLAKNLQLRHKEQKQNQAVGQGLWKAEYVWNTMYAHPLLPVVDPQNVCKQPACLYRKSTEHPATRACSSSFRSESLGSVTSLSQARMASLPSPQGYLGASTPSVGNVLYISDWRREMHKSLSDTGQTLTRLVCLGASVATNKGRF
ncbi:SLIT-ROBO Rho GTPase-activating protein 1 [Homalodisca vitripennis]|nr:SLIT-ROBO Rho GTPase-activating protein 1 [Homalodisca vitripennis]